MNRPMKKMTPLLAAIALGSAAIACDIDRTEDGRLPSIDVDVDAGEMPTYDVDVADVDVGTTEDTVIIRRPTVDVRLPDDTTAVEGDGGSSTS